MNDPAERPKFAPSPEERWWAVMPFVRALYELASHGLVDAEALYAAVASSPVFAAVPERPGETPQERGRRIVEAIRNALRRVDVRAELDGRIGAMRPDQEMWVCWTEHALDGRSLAEVGRRLNYHYDHDLDQATLRARMWISRVRHSKNCRGEIAKIVRLIEEELGAPISVPDWVPADPPELAIGSNSRNSEVQYDYLNERTGMSAEAPTDEQASDAEIMSAERAARFTNVVSRYMHEPEYRDLLDVLQLLGPEELRAMAEDVRRRHAETAN
jgi:hypothetical protein